jgi:hypothetical protein
MNICNKLSELTHPNFMSGIIVTALFLIFVYVLFFKFRNKLKPLQFILFSIVALLFYIFTSVTIDLTIYLIYSYDDNPPSVHYHDLNAAIKLRCFSETDRKYCPRTAQDVRNIAPDKSKPYLNNAQITYVYYANTNNYSLVIRNNNILRNNSRAALFDSRLPNAKEYGRKGIDFFDVNIVNNCNGTYTITNPPPFEGPWREIR